MILKDKYENIRLFGVNIKHNQITAKVAWINRNAKKTQKVFSIANPNIWYIIHIGKEFSNKPIPIVLENLYVPIVSKNK